MIWKQKFQWIERELSDLVEQTGRSCAIATAVEVTQNYIIPTKVHVKPELHYLGSRRGR